MTAPLILDERLLGAIPSPTDPLDFQLLPKLDMAAKLPSRFVSPLMAPPLNQGNTGRCVAFSSTGVKQWEERRDGHGFLPLDADWLYLQAGGSADRQRGLTCRNALGVLLKQGIPIVGHPGTASDFRIGEYYAVPFIEDAIKRAVMQFGPLLIATQWFANWFHPVKGVIPSPIGPAIGGHARVLFGWDDSVAGGTAITRNSWGKGWGTNGNSYDAWRHLIPAIHDAWKVIDRKGA